ncbi:mechanosensitive ion channel domain-containing protein [Pendulispora albinea]|uniref:Mechanosensitive ion channel family protein n=1 Tax=Pendulispora albinea TaxID=2741071 RepID=A0ABZ2LP89_9BACT
MAVGPDYVAIWIGRILLALVVSALWIWILRSLGRMLRSLVAFIDRRLRRRGKGFHFRSVEVLGVDTIIGFFRSLIGMTRALGSLTVTYLWILVVAWALDPNRRVFGVVVQPLVTVLTHAFEALLGFIPNLVMLIIIFSMARFSTRSVAVLTDAVRLRKLELDWLEPELAVPTRRIVTILIWVLALVMSGPYLPGSESKAFLGVAIMVGVLLAVGARSVTSNLLAGLVLTYSRAYRTGDRVRIGETTGEVLTLGALTTRLRTEENREVVIPNAVAQSGLITHMVSRPRSLSTINAYEFVRQTTPPSVPAPRPVEPLAARAVEPLAARAVEPPVAVPVPAPRPAESPAPPPPDPAPAPEALEVPPVPPAGASAASSSGAVVKEESP